ncbi:MAG: GTPase Era [Bacteroidota bacterium]|nr:GTPase Era [Bacteroidota bacterium]MEC7829983.1 GTPase Era [Bacteroidota bacterium]|tara:strand:+ start:1564 stop:2442 length:879 start_codon:yes stop_codon:yes gene_type:complete
MHKSGFVNVIGMPNVGKSSLINLLIGENLLITSPKAQTTRHRILGILSSDKFQLIFSDTPGLIKPNYKLQESMVNATMSVLKDADIFLLVIQIGDNYNFDYDLTKKIILSKKPIIILINKIDLGDQKKLEKTIEFWKKIIPDSLIIPISVKEKFQTDNLVEKIVELLPIHPAYFPKDQLTDKTERFFVNEKIREKILNLYKQEIPYSVEVETEVFDFKDKILKLSSVIYVERETQKGILIGHNGESIKKLGVEARKDLENFFNKKIHLELYVKVNKNWRSSSTKLKRFGYQT